MRGPRHIYDSQGRTTSQTEAVATNQTEVGTSPATTGFDYDLAGNRLTATSPRGIVSAWTYTGRNLVASMTEAFATPIAATTTFTYSPTGKIVTTTDALGRITTNTYGVSTLPECAAI